MKRFLIKLLMTLLFLLLLGFAFKNTESVAVRYFLGFEWQAQLVLVLLIYYKIRILFQIILMIQMHNNMTRLNYCIIAES